MANITAELQAILAAVLGEEVRGSIYSAINKINIASENAISSGTAINAGDPVASPELDKALYINTNTNELLRANTTNWVLVGRIKGNGITSITGPDPGTSPLDDVYTINYLEGSPTTFTVHNGKGITSVGISSQSGLIDTYTILYNDGTSDTFSIKNGNQWYYGIAITGTSTTPTSFVLPFEVKPGDSYLNISNDSIYHCTVGAPAGGSSSWVYDFTITSTSTGTNNYNMLLNLPKINTVEVKGTQTGHDLGLLDEARADAWLMDGANPMQKPMPVNSTSVSFSSAEMADIYSNGWAVKAYFNVADGQPAPSFKKMVKDATTGALTISYTKVKAAQAGVSGNECYCQLRIVK